jgi:hypothetical protein
LPIAGRPWRPGMKGKGKGHVVPTQQDGAEQRSRCKKERGLQEIRNESQLCVNLGAKVLRHMRTSVCVALPGNLQFRPAQHRDQGQEPILDTSLSASGQSSWQLQSKSSAFIYHKLFQ